MPEALLREIIDFIGGGNGALWLLQLGHNVDLGVLEASAGQSRLADRIQEHDHHRRERGVGRSAPILFGCLCDRAHKDSGMALDFICWLPSAIPGVLSGLGLLWMFLGTPIFRPFYRTLTLLVLASVLGGVTISTQLLKANLIQLGRELEEASFVSGAGFWRTYLNILLPLTAQAMVLIGVLKFIFAAQNVSNIILLATSELRTMSLLAWDQIGEGLREAASVTIIIVILMTLGLALVARFLGLRVGIQDE